MKIALLGDKLKKGCCQCLGPFTRNVCISEELFQDNF